MRDELKTGLDVCLKQEEDISDLKRELSNKKSLMKVRSFISEVYFYVNLNTTINKYFN